MKYRIKLDLVKLVSQTLTNGFSLFFNNISNLSNWHDEEEAPTVTNLEINVDSNASKRLYVFIEESVNPDYDFQDGDITYAAESHGVITFDCEIELTEMTDLLTLISKGIVILDWDGYTSMILYRQNSANNVVTKSLTLKAIIQGKFNIPVGLKNINLDLEGTLIDFDTFNYVYIPLFERYYYVNSVQLVTDKIVRYVLGEDVLMSWSTLIKTQNAFITRQASASNKKLVDNRRPLEDVMTVTYRTPTPTSSGLTNITLALNLADNKYKYLISSVTDDVGYKYKVNTPTGSNLPEITLTSSKNERLSFLNADQIGYLVNAMFDDDTTASYINSVVLLPFDPDNAFRNAGTNGFVANGPTMANDKYLYDDGKFHRFGEAPAGVNMVAGYLSQLGAMPYFILADFSIEASSNYLDYEPYTYMEIYIAFVGWTKVNLNQVRGKRILIYYTLDYKTGMGTAYLYNLTDSKLIYSTNCQLGIKLDITTSNATEIAKQKQANELNMILGLMTSALSIGVGVASENPVAIAGGVLSAGKTLASYVNNNNMLFERAQTSFGTSEGIFHSPVGYPIIRETKHKEILSNYTEETIFASLNGFPANTYSSLSALSGYTEIGEIQFNPSNYAISQDEINEIVALLKNGVIL